MIYSIIIPAYNEELYLPSTIESIKKAIKSCDYDAEIIVVDNNSSDLTNSLACLSGVRVVFEKENHI